MSMKTIGVLTSGGDAPGMNAAVRAAVRTALDKGMKVIGINHGYQGLIQKEFFDMNLRSVSDIIHRGGTALYTARSPQFCTEEGMLMAVKACHEAGIEGIVCVGGDGTFRGARDLSNRGIPCVGVPGTIDNDIACTEYSIGFDTAANTCMEMVDRLRDTSQSHERCSVVQVMGRHAGYLALYAGLACGAVAVMVPEIPVDLERDILPKMRRTQLTGKKHYIVVVAEGVGGVADIAKRIQEVTGIESRATVLGHVQRGGIPSVRDRVVASQMGNRAAELLSRGIGNRVVAMQHSEIVDFDINEALDMTKPFDETLYHVANAISI